MLPDKLTFKTVLDRIYGSGWEELLTRMAKKIKIIIKIAISVPKTEAKNVLKNCIGKSV